MKARRGGAFGRLVMIAALGLGVTAQGLADDVVMKTSVRLGPDAREVRLGDIARLDGPLATAQADLVVTSRDDVNELIEVSVADVRRALDDAGVHWGKVNLTGRRTIIRPAPDSLAATPAAMTPTSLVEPTSHHARKSSKDQATSAAVLAREDSLRGEIARYVLANLQQRPETVGLQFDPKDAPALSTVIGGRRLEIEPLSSLAAEQFQVAVRMWDEGRIVDRQRFTGQVMVRARTLSAARDLERGHVLTESDIEMRDEWLAPQLVNVAATHADAVGRALVKRLKPGDRIRRVDVERQAMVHRGDHVTVRCLVGGLVVRMKAEVRAEGAQGDLVVCRKLGERETFLATVVAPGEVVVDLQ